MGAAAAKTQAEHGHVAHRAKVQAGVALVKLEGVPNMQVNPAAIKLSALRLPSRIGHGPDEWAGTHR